MAPNPLENVSTSLESDGVTKPAGQQKPARLGWGMSLNRASNSERTIPSPPPSLLPWATTASKEGVETEDEKKTTYIEREKVVNNNEPGSQGSAKLDQVNGGSRSPITPGICLIVKHDILQHTYKGLGLALMHCFCCIIVSML